jgi:hypothetical protein
MAEVERIDQKLDDKFQPHGRPLLMFLAFCVRHHPQDAQYLNLNTASSASSDSRA